jgi:23S rRNA (adenine2503-C2)-methyltransferase
MNNVLCGTTLEEINELIIPQGFKSSFSVKVLTSVYRNGIRNISEIPDVPRKLKEFLTNHLLAGFYPPVTFQESADGSVKYLFRNAAGLEFETVFLPDKKRKTVCVSTQSGCRMGCPFCLTGKYGFKGNLTSGDIINQIMSIPFASEITHVVFMGMGEPMDNLSQVLKSCDILTAGWGMAISPRNVTVSTVGILDGVTKFLQQSNCNLTFSLHSPFPVERKLLIPSEGRNPAVEIIELIKQQTIKKKRRFSIAYVMIKDVNDTEKHLNALINLLEGSSIRVNLLTYHRVPDNTNISSSHERMHYFKHNLIIRGISASIRKSRGGDISAACGLLAGRLTEK